MDLMTLRARLLFDSSEFDDGMEQAQRSASTFGDVLKANLVTKGVELATKGIAKLTETTIGFTRSAIEGYAEYEQLAGGIETMFEDLNWDIYQNADNAFKTAGLSANEYMDTIMGFSASLTSSLKAQQGNISEAAERADQIIIDMSDNANKMGTSMEMIQNAYSGFAKANYTMLDNLKLGYGGTKEEMERLLEDAEKISGKHYDITYFSDIAEAIHVIQEDMDIAGTTAKEANETIAGSLASLRSAWSNLLTGLARDDADLDSLINNVVDSAEIAFNNIMPVAEKALDGITKLIDKIAPIIEEKLPPLVEKVLPAIMKAGSAIFGAVLPAIPKAASAIISTLFNAMVEEAPAMIPLVAAAIASPILGMVKNIAGGIGALKTAIGGIGTAASSAAGGVGEMASAGGNLIGVLGAVKTAALLAADAILIAYDVNAMKQAVEDWEQVGEDAHRAKWNEEATYLENYVKLYDEKGKEVADKFAQMAVGVDTTAMGFEEAQEALSRKVEENWSGVATNIGEGLMGGLEYYFGKDGKGGGFWGLMGDAFTNAVDGVAGILGISSPSRVFERYGIYTMEGFERGIDEKKQSVFDKLRNVANTITETFRRVLKIHSPSAVFEEAGLFTMEGLDNGLDSGAKSVYDTMDRISERIAGYGTEMTSVQTTPQEMASMIPSGSPQNGPQTAYLVLDREILGKVVYTLNNERTQRVGVQIAGGYV